ncbi:anthranilate synthase component I [Bosea sp. (in: a-proteobacteria)]|uniref:anthranilate synthase component I n=1 Tax=Bosea sp. (in: a-proteobacteria) TaxID=1871050 RepID=UPI002734ECFA|nr:anthranilate synthase component I [Bosea sp. (in: a-proteobacteria)]MDP3256781.1 anthranilate synthase component I [Bosea sp. (in: a-proteobacteria)]
MALAQDQEAFIAAYEAGTPQVLRQVLVGDCETPVAAFLKLRHATTGPAFLLESVEGGAVRGRYSMIGLEPDLIWRCHRGEAALCRPALGDGFLADPRPAFESLRALLDESAIPETDALADGDLPPMAAGVFGYLGYDMVRLMERLPEPKDTGTGVPDAILTRPTLMVVFDSVRDEIHVVTPVRHQPGVPARAAHERALERLDAVVRALEGPLPPDAAVDIAALPEPAIVSNTTEAQFHAMVATAQDYIRAGDIFQVVLSQRFEAPFQLPPFALYRALRRVNPAPFLCYLDFADFQIVCSSPEILVRLRDDTVTIRPIAGTRRRGATPAEDEALAQELLADPKERAEHLMLLDLGRNDVGRVADIGTIKVTDQFILEYYSQVMHIVSNVEGRLSNKFDTIDALVAGFPAGTVSGAPKVRAMEIIDELEKNKRGVYAGCVGYFSADGEMDTCIVLRTAIVKDGKMYVQAGAGVVADSDPESEHQECVNKAKALFRAAEEAVRFAGRAGRAQ